MTGRTLLLRMTAAVALVYLTLVFVDAASAPQHQAAPVAPVSCSAAEWSTCA